MKIKDLPKFTRPREKLKAKGPQSLSDFELLQALIGSGNKQSDVTKIAKEVKNLLQKYGASITYAQLEKINGLGSPRIALNGPNFCHTIQKQKPKAEAKSMV